MDELTRRRLEKTDKSSEVNPRDMLALAAEEFDPEKHDGVYIIFTRKDDADHLFFAGGPKLSTYKKVWQVLQTECLRVLDEMLGERE